MSGVDRANAIRILSPSILEVEPVGSRVTCDPPPLDTDEDYLVLIKWDSWGPFRDEMKALGWGCGEGGEGEEYIEDEIEFRSLRKGELNLIVTESGDFFDRFMKATRIARRLNLLEKGDRISLFQAILYGRVMSHD